MPHHAPYRLFAAALTAGLLAGCAAVPHVQREVAQTSAAAMGLAPAGAPSTIPVAADWWQAIGDPQLDRIMSDALAGNPTLDAALARVRIAQAGIAAQRAGQLPQLDADISEQRQRLSGSYIIPPPYGGSSQWVGTAQANLDWSLDLAGKQKALVSQARASAAATALDAAAARVVIGGAVAQAYVNLARADQQARIAREFVASRQTALQLAQIRQRSNLASDFDIRAAQTLLSQAQQAGVRAEGDRALMIHALAALAGRGADYYPTITPSAVALETVLPVPAQLPADLLGRRPDILAAQARIDAADAGRRVARAAFYPDVDLKAFVGTSALGLGALFTGSAVAAGAGPAIHLPIFEGGALRAHYTAAVGSIDLAVADYNSLVVDAVKQAADALSGVDTAEAEARDQRAIVADLQDTVRLDQTRVTSGLGSQLDILATNDRLLAARQAQTDFDADGAVRRVQLLVALGGGFSPLPTQPLALNDAGSTHR